MTRGALAYDVLMNWRFRRGDAKEAMNLLCRMAATWNQEDKNDRDGRRSFQTLEQVIQAHPHYSRIDMI